MKRQIIIFIAISLFNLTSVYSQDTKIKIWTTLAPGTENSANKEEWQGNRKVFKVYQPDLTVFMPENTQEQLPAIIVCPGGGYRQLEMEKEGYKIARWLNDNNIAAFVLKYRLNPEAALQDARQAMKVLRNKCEELNINKNKIGIMGFSAGAHLAANLATHYKTDTKNFRPDFWIGIYGVYRQNKQKTFGELIDENTPPVLLIHAGNDSKVPAIYSVQLYTYCKEKGVPAELHVYEKGEHGFALETNRGSEVTSTVNNWSERCLEWLKIQGVLSW